MLHPLIILLDHLLTLELNLHVAAFHLTIDQDIDLHNHLNQLILMLFVHALFVLLYLSFGFLVQIQHFPELYDVEIEQSFEKPYSFSFYVLHVMLPFVNSKYPSHPLEWNLVLAQSNGSLNGLM